jgi:hypothetical protein
MGDESSNPIEPATAAELHALVEKAQSGDSEALPRINQILDANPVIWKRLGDIGSVTEKAWVSVLAEKNPLIVEAIARTLAEMRSDLAGKNPSQIEKVLVDQIVLCWLQMQALGFGCANLERSGGTKTNRAHVRLDLANKRHLAALKALADLRRLAPGALVSGSTLKIFEKQTVQA